MSWNNATTNEIDKIIIYLKTRNSTGYDEIHIKILTLVPCLSFPIILYL